MIIIVEIHNHVCPPSCWSVKSQKDFVKQINALYPHSQTDEYEACCDWFAGNIGPFMVFETREEAEIGYRDSSLWRYHGCEAARARLKAFLKTPQ